MTALAQEALDLCEKIIKTTHKNNFAHEMRGAIKLTGVAEQKTLTKLKRIWSRDVPKSAKLRAGYEV